MRQARSHRKRQIFGRPPGFPGFPDRDDRDGRDEPEEERPNRGHTLPRPPIFGRPPANSPTETEEEIEIEPSPQPDSPAPSRSQVVPSPSNSPPPAPPPPPAAPSPPAASSTLVVLTTSDGASPPVSMSSSNSGQISSPTQLPQVQTVSPSGSLQVEPSTIPTVGAASRSNVGPIVGGVIGGLVGFGLLCLAVIFIGRRLRKRKMDDSFNPSQFRKSAFVLGDADPSDPFMAEQRPLSQPVSLSFTYPSSSYGSSIRSFPSVHHGMPQDNRYQYEGQPMVPDHLYQQQPAGYQYTPLERVSPLDTNPTQTMTSSSLTGKVLPPTPMPSTQTAEPTSTSGKSRPPTTVYDPDDAYGGIRS